jgi:hypothetical protein
LFPPVVCLNVFWSGVDHRSELDIATGVEMVAMVPKSNQAWQAALPPPADVKMVHPSASCDPSAVPVTGIFSPASHADGAVGVARNVFSTCSNAVKDSSGHVPPGQEVLLADVEEKAPATRKPARALRLLLKESEKAQDGSTLSKWEVPSAGNAEGLA